MPDLYKCQQVLVQEAEHLIQNISKSKSHIYSLTTVNFTHLHFPLNVSFFKAVINHYPGQLVIS